MDRDDQVFFNSLDLGLGLGADFFSPAIGFCRLPPHCLLPSTTTRQLDDPTGFTQERGIGPLAVDVEIDLLRAQ